jgi:hypothetical protein
MRPITTHLVAEDQLGLSRRFSLCRSSVMSPEEATSPPAPGARDRHELLGVTAERVTGERRHEPSAQATG